MTAWPQVPLREVLVAVERAEQVQPLREYKLLGVRLDGQGPFLRETKFGSQVSATTFHRVETGDFIYSRLFAWRGAFGVVPQELDGCYVSGEFPMFRPVPGRADAEFVRLWFRLGDTLDKVLADCTGSTPLTRNRFKEEFFLRLQIPLPPLPEQRRIVARIEELAGKVEGIRSLQHEILLGLDSVVLSVQHYASVRTVALGEALELSVDRVAVKPNETYPQVGVRSFGVGLFPRETLTAMDTTYKHFNRLYEGAVVLSQVKGWEGAIAVCDAVLAGRYVSPEYRTFRCVPTEADPTYMRALVATPWFHEMLKTATRGVGGRRERTRPEMFLALTIPLPSVERQRQAAVALSRFGELKRLQAETQAELDALLPSILDRAFKGEL